ncbi:MAG: hypothetical protein ABI876_08345, partial [Bacteroidota bacterium]
ISLELDTTATPLDVSGFIGIRLRIKSAKGALAMKAMTSGVKNYDFHAMAIERTSDFQQFDIPFASLRQIWSAQVPWSGKDMRGVAFWVSGFAPTDYDFTIDSIELYTAGK